MSIIKPICQISQIGVTFSRFLPAPDSDATTVPASTPTAKRMAAAGTKAVRESEATEPAEEQPTRTPLNRAVQSKTLLDAAPEPETKEAAEPERKRLRRQNAAQIKESSSTASVEPPTAKHTAAKAKVAPPKQCPKHELTKDEPDRALAQSVAECLQRSSTQDIAQANSQEPGEKENNAAQPPPPPKEKETEKTQPTKKVAPAPPGDPEDPSDSEADVDVEEERRKDELVRAKREAHARYMRFSRSLSSPLAIN